MDKESLVLIKQCNTRQEAAIIQGLLQSAGIDSMIQADDAGGMYPLPGRSGFGPVSILVRESEAESARKILTPH